VKDVDEDKAKGYMTEGLKHKDALEFFIENNPRTLENLQGLMSV